MQIVKSPAGFDVLVTENLFGDILSDEASVLAGSLGMLPSASVGERRTLHGLHGLYEPIHGSAPDIAGRDLANPIGTILSGAMLLRWSLGRAAAADAIEAAVSAALDDGYRTADLWPAAGAADRRPDPDRDDRHDPGGRGPDRDPPGGAGSGGRPNLLTRPPSTNHLGASRDRPRPQARPDPGPTASAPIASDRPVVLYDTTLRDGTQGENIILSLADKLRIARMLDEFGMPYIEGGWPGSNPKDVEFFAAARTMTLARRPGWPPSGPPATGRTGPTTTRTSASSWPPRRRSSPSSARAGCST